MIQQDATAQSLLRILKKARVKSTKTNVWAVGNVSNGMIASSHVTFDKEQRVVATVKNIGPPCCEID